MMTQVFRFFNRQGASTSSETGSEELRQIDTSATGSVTSAGSVTSTGSVTGTVVAELVEAPSGLPSQEYSRLIREKTFSSERTVSSTFKWPSASTDSVNEYVTSAPGKRGSINLRSPTRARVSPLPRWFSSSSVATRICTAPGVIG